MASHIDYRLRSESKTKIDFQKICICCCEEKVELLYLSTCNVSYVLRLLVDIKISNGDKICSVCLDMLRNIHKFKKQVEDNNQLLQEFNKNFNTTKFKMDNLTMSKTTVISTTLPINLEQETFEHDIIKKENIKNETLEIKLPLDTPQTQTELLSWEIEHTYQTAVQENSLEDKEELVENSNTFVEMLPVIKNNPRTPLEANYRGKIRIVTLSMKDLIKEREEEMADEKFLNAPFKCKDCLMRFQFEDRLIDHMEKKHNEKNKDRRTCTVCNIVMTSESNSAKHYRRHFTRYECIKCGYRAKKVYPVLTHCKTTHGNIFHTFKCNLCDFTTDSHTLYRNHRSRHGKMYEITENTCKVCCKSFTRRDGYTTHMRMIHERRSVLYPCDVCGKSYRSPQKLRQHRLTHDPDSHGTYYCTICDRLFKTYRTLEIHLKKHSTSSNVEKRFICDDCGKKYVNKRDLIDHINFVHLKTFNYSCLRCPKIFQSQSCLTNHTKYVHDKIRLPKNKICDYCGRGFRNIAALQSHIRIHTGERPFRCTECSATFSHSATLNRHKRLLHDPDRISKRRRCVK